MKALWTIMLAMVLLLVCNSCAQKVEKKDGIEKFTAVYEELISYLESEGVQTKINEAAKNTEEFEKLLADIDEKIEEIAEKNGYKSEKEWNEARDNFKDNEKIMAMRDKVVAMITPRMPSSGMKRGDDNAALIEWEIQEILKNL